MKLRNFLYLNNKIVDDYLSVIDGYVYNEEAQSIATSTENEVKAGGSVKLLKGEGSHAGKGKTIRYNTRNSGETFLIVRTVSMI